MFVCLVSNYLEMFPPENGREGITEDGAEQQEADTMTPHTAAAIAITLINFI